MSLGQLKETIGLHVIGSFGSEYPTQRLLAALTHQTKVPYFYQKLIELVNISPSKVTALINQHFMI